MIKKNAIAIYSAGLVQGMTLVAFPAASTIITNPSGFNFSTTEYGSLFIPQAIMSIASSALNPKLGTYFNQKLILIFGLIANLISMGLLAISPFFINDKHLAHLVLAFATSFLGISFGLTVPTLNYLTCQMFPKEEDSHLLILNALLGTGCTLSPLFIAAFVEFGFWWEFPALLFIAILYLLIFTRYLDLPSDNKSCNVVTSIPKRVWIFAAFALLYGIIETLNGNWVSIYMNKHMSSNHVIQSLALTAFWGMVTFGRVFFAADEKLFKAQLTYQISPFITVLAFIITTLLPSGREYSAIFAFALAGLGCSSLLPLTISFASKELKSIASCVPGIVISFYLLGYGIGAFGVGPLEELSHLTLREIYAIGAVIAFILGIISLFIIKSKKVEEKL